ncbi:MAG: hypothetical protein U9P14_05930 [Gemmatimonadota bacterium]|nr:hypothetical protein [Gemmatimonadota bacterium]
MLLQPDRETRVVSGIVLLWVTMSLILHEPVRAATQVECSRDTFKVQAEVKSRSSSGFFHTRHSFTLPGAGIFPDYRLSWIGLKTKRLVPLTRQCCLLEKLSQSLDSFDRMSIKNGGLKWLAGGAPRLKGALMAGKELYDFSKEITTYGTHWLHTGYDFGILDRRSLRTGIYCKF